MGKGHRAPTCTGHGSLCILGHSVLTSAAFFLFCDRRSLITENSGNLLRISQLLSGVRSPTSVAGWLLPKLASWGWKDDALGCPSQCVCFRGPPPHVLMGRIQGKLRFVATRLSPVTDLCSLSSPPPPVTLGLGVKRRLRRS